MANTDTDTNTTNLFPCVFGHESLEASKRVNAWMKEQIEMGRTLEVAIGECRDSAGKPFFAMAISSHSPNYFGGQNYHGSMAADGNLHFWG